MNLQHFDLRQTNAFRAVILRRMIIHPGIAVLIALLLLPVIAGEVMQSYLKMIGGSALVLGFALHVLLKLRRELRHNVPMDVFPENAAEALSYHMVEHISTKTEVTPTTLLEAATESERGLFVLHQIGIEQRDVLNAWTSQKETVSLETFFDWILEAKKTLGTSTLDSTATIFASFTQSTALTALLNAVDVSVEDLRNILTSEVFHYEKSERHKHWLSPDCIVRYAGSIGRTWVMGYNTELERLTENVSTHILSHERDVIVHRKEVDQLFEMLSGSSRKNMLILGGPGTGKRTLVRNAVLKLKKYEMARGIGFTDVLLLKTPQLLSGTAAGDKELLSALEKATLGGRFVIVIEDLAQLLSVSDARLKEVLFSLLQAKNLRTIGIVGTAEYHTKIKQDPGLDALFEKTILEETSESDTMAVLLEEYFVMERERKVRVTYKALTSILELSTRFIGAVSLPGKAVDTLQEAVSLAKTQNETTVTDAHIRDVITRTSHVDVHGLSTGEKQKLLALEDRLHEHIVGQQHAISSLVRALKRARLDVGSRKRPMGTFLFLGTTGVGKTETAKALALEYFGSADSMIRVDMNECGTENAISSLIGGQTHDGFHEGMLTKKVQDKPFSLILLDEIEKAHPKILNLFLQILDEGMLIDGAGVKTDFRNTIIIATSNAGSHWLADKSSPAHALEGEEFRKALIETVLNERTFSPEFVNRFDEVIVFHSPTEDDIKRIAILMLDDIIKSIQEKRGVNVTMEQGVVDVLAKRGFDPEFGAREMRRTITQTVETYLADYLLTHEVKRGDTIVIRAEDIRR